MKTILLPNGIGEHIVLNYEGDLESAIKSANKIIKEYPEGTLITEITVGKSNKKPRKYSHKRYARMEGNPVEDMEITVNYIGSSIKDSIMSFLKEAKFNPDKYYSVFITIKELS